MSKRMICLAISLLLVLGLCACAEKGGEKYGVGRLAWGESAERLLRGEGVAEYEVVDLFAEYAGCTGTLHYRFDESGGLYAAHYEFNADGASDPIALYKTLLASMESEYGESAGLVTNDAEGKPVPAPTIGDAELSGELNCIDSWSGLPAPDGSKVSANLQLYPDGKITLSFFAH